MLKCRFEVTIFAICRELGGERYPFTAELCCTQRLSRCHDTMLCNRRKTCDFVVRYHSHRVACVIARGHRSSQDVVVVISFNVLRCQGDLLGTMRLAGIEHVLFMRVESTVWHDLTNQSRGEEVERRKSRWRTYRFDCYLRNFELASSPPYLPDIAVMVDWALKNNYLSISSMRA